MVFAPWWFFIKFLSTVYASVSNFSYLLMSTNFLGHQEEEALAAAATPLHPNASSSISSTSWFLSGKVSPPLSPPHFLSLCLCFCLSPLSCSAISVSLLSPLLCYMSLSLSPLLFCCLWVGASLEDFLRCRCVMLLIVVTLVA
jgi:hypothetical protein